MGHLQVTKKRGISVPRIFFQKGNGSCLKLYPVNKCERAFSYNVIPSLTHIIFSRILGASSPLCYKQLGRGWDTSKHNCLVSYLFCSRRHVSATVGRFQVSKMYIQETIQSMILKKAVPLQAWSGPEGSRKLSFLDYMTTAQDGGKTVSLTHRPHLPPRKCSWYSFLLEAESTPGP